MKSWRLRTSLVVLLTLISSISLLIVAAVLFLVRLPLITDETQADLRVEATDLAARSEIIFGALETQLNLLASVLFVAPGVEMQTALNGVVAEGRAFSAIYQIGDNGKILRAAVNPSLGSSLREEIVGNDLSRDPLFLKVRGNGISAWSDKYLSPVSNGIAVGIAVPSGSSVLIGEVPLDYVLQTLRAASGRKSLLIWIADSNGEILADSERASRIGVVNLGSLSLLSNRDEFAVRSARVQFEGQEFEAAVARSRALHWDFVLRTPAGLDNPRIGSTLDLGIAALLGSMLLGLGLASLWASSLARPISTIAERARRIADGEPPGAWPRSHTIELNELSADLERMASKLNEREKELEGIFNASPIGIAVLDPARGFAFVKANDNALRLIGIERNSLLGRNSLELGLWRDTSSRQVFFETLRRQGYAQTETWLRRVDGTEYVGDVSVQLFSVGGIERAILVLRDVTELRRIQSEIRALNAELELRVEVRTEELHRANAELSQTIDHLQFAQAELVRAEKLASLGSMVAGVAHELNTPLGNGLLAVSTIRAALRDFQKESAEGLRRSSLAHLLASVETGGDIAERNLARAAELVASFKQLAADQTTSQRREFALDEVIGEILLTLRPTLTQHGVTVENGVPKGIQLDSYPGPLGQIITNLLNNAMVHAFDHTESPRIRIECDVAEEQVVLTVADNGCGIPESLLPKIFDPFMTTRLGRGGSGLGLHISHNLAVGTLGGGIGVESTVGVGTIFRITIPKKAPVIVATTD